MAKLENGKTFVTLRFLFGEDNVKGRQRTDDTYRYAVKRLTFTYAENEYKAMRTRLQEGVEADIRRELVNLASLYRRHIIGANGNKNVPAGVIRSAIGNAAPLSLSAALPAWAPRDAKYVQRKQNARAGSGWFDNRGWKRQPGQNWSPDDSGLLFESMRAETWEKMFGPVSVKFYKNNKIAANGGNNGEIKLANNHAVAQIGTLRVMALGLITPAMLPALRSKNEGSIPMASDEGNPGLMRLVGAYDPRVAFRLGQRSHETKRYRPTLEPFLSYLLTRSIPAAVQARIRQGSLKRITRS